MECTTNEIYKKAKELRYEDFVTWFDSNNTKDTTTKSVEILEEVDYSVDGILNMIDSQPERKKDLLFAVDNEYCRLRDAFDSARKLAVSISIDLNIISSCFVGIYMALIKHGATDHNKLAFSNSNGNVVVEIATDRSIKYECHNRADL